MTATKQTTVATGTAADLILDTINLAANVGATDDFIARTLTLSNSTVRHARRKLAEAGLVRDSGRRRLTAEGRLAKVWVKGTARKR